MVPSVFLKCTLWLSESEGRPGRLRVAGYELHIKPQARSVALALPSHGLTLAPMQRMLSCCLSFFHSSKSITINNQRKLSFFHFHFRITVNGSYHIIYHII